MKSPPIPAHANGLTDPARARCRRAGPIRLLLVTDTPIQTHGGSERFIRNLMTGLDPEHFDIDLLQLQEAPEGVTGRLPEAVNLRCRTRQVDTVRSLAALRAMIDLQLRSRRGRYHIIQSQHEKSDLFCALLPARPGQTVRISNRRDSGFNKSPLLRGVFRRLNPRFEHIVAPSRGLLNLLCETEGIDPARTLCLPNGVDTDRFRPADPQLRPGLRAELGLPDGFLVACAARLAPIKRHEDLLEAFFGMASERPRARLLLFGDGPLEDRLRQAARASGIGDRVHFFGEVRNMETVLPLMDAFALASSTEGMSNAIIEAMAAGLPVVATAVGGTPESVVHEDTGLLVPPMEPRRMSQALARLHDHPETARDMGRHGRQRAEREFSLRAMLDGYSRLYQDLHAELAEASA